MTPPRFKLYWIKRRHTWTAGYFFWKKIIVFSGGSAAQWHSFIFLFLVAPLMYRLSDISGDPVMTVYLMQMCWSVWWVRMWRHLKASEEFKIYEILQKSIKYFRSYNKLNEGDPYPTDSSQKIGILSYLLKDSQVLGNIYYEKNR